MELLFFDVGGGEVLMIAIVALLLFGGNKLPELMRGIGKGIREFNSARANVEQEIREGIKAAEDAAKIEVDDNPSDQQNHQQII